MGNLSASVSACSRIDLLGGTLDIWPMYLFFPGAATLNVAIDRSVYFSLAVTENEPAVKVTSRDTGLTVSADSWEALSNRKDYALFFHLFQYFDVPWGASIVTDNKFPRGSGLGGSSSLLIAAILCFLEITGKNLPPAEIISLAKDLEVRAIRVPTGIQDYYPPLYGGINSISLEPGEVVRKMLHCDIRALEERLLLCYSGQAHFSGSNNWAVFKSIIDGNKEAMDIMRQLAENSRNGVKVLEEEDFARFGRFIDRDWELRKRLIPEFSTGRIEKILKIAGEHGSMAGKACGAGGGGCVVLYCHEGKKEGVKEALLQAEFAPLDFTIRPAGQGWGFTQK